jgi:ATP-dependent RNA helicase DDX23/PRP28
MDTATRNFLQTKSYVAKESNVLTDRDWRLFREDNLISVKGGKCPPPIRKWEDIPEMPKDLSKNIMELGFDNPMPI